MTSFENGLHNDEDEDEDEDEDDDDDESCARLSAQTNYAKCICSPESWRRSPGIVCAKRSTLNN